MLIALLLASEDCFFRQGVFKLSEKLNNFLCYHFNDNFMELERAERFFGKIYFICDSQFYYFFSRLFYGSDIHCLQANQVKLHQGKLSLDDERMLFSADTQSFKTIEREILYLYYFRKQSIQQISIRMGISEKSIFYRMNKIKSKLAVNTKWQLFSSLSSEMHAFSRF